MKDCLWRDVQSQGTNMSIWLPVLAQEEAIPTLRPEKQGRRYHSIQVTGKPLTRAMVTWPCWVSSSNAVLRHHQLSVPNSVSCWHLPIHPKQKSAFVGDASRSGSPWGSVPLLPPPPPSDSSATGRGLNRPGGREGRVSDEQCKQREGLQEWLCTLEGILYEGFSRRLSPNDNLCGFRCLLCGWHCSSSFTGRAGRSLSQCEGLKKPSTFSWL